MSNNVNHPDHYSDPSGIECIEIVRHRDFCVGNAIKYLWRAGLKKSGSLSDVEKEIEDLKKAKWYIEDKIASLEGKNKQFISTLNDQQGNQEATVTTSVTLSKSVPRVDKLMGEEAFTKQSLTIKEILQLFSVMTKSKIKEIEDENKAVDDTFDEYHNNQMLALLDFQLQSCEGWIQDECEYIDEH